MSFDFSSRIQLKNDRSAEVLYTGDIWSITRLNQETGRSTINLLCHNIREHECHLVGLFCGHNNLQLTLPHLPHYLLLLLLLLLLRSLLLLLLICSYTLIYAIGAGITAAAGTRLALQLILVKGFKFYSFQLQDMDALYCYFLSLPPCVRIG